MVTKKDFKAIAEIIKRQVDCGSEQDLILVKAAKDIGQIYATNLADYFTEQNPNFDRERFMKVCGLA